MAARFVRVGMIFFFLVAVSGCGGEKQEPLRSVGDVQRKTVLKIPPTARVIEGEEVTTVSHGNGINVQLMMSRKEYGEFLAETGLTAHPKSPNLAGVPLRTLKRWHLDTLTPQSLTVYGSRSTGFAARNEQEAEVTLYLWTVN